ncbi:MAG: outer membrane beta-barrel protein [Candidatus Aminicenantes bacterium]|nr:MAG: outer membrane beta-barrel protein [Candidatus Aminicenantes bacterium]
MKRKILCLFIFTMVFAAGVVQVNAGDFWLALQGGHFNPTEQAFKNIYGGGVTYGGELGVDLYKWLSLWAGGGFFFKTGELSYTKEETKLKMSHLEIGVRFKLPLKRFIPYIGGGAGICRFKENNIIGEARDNEGSFFGQAGILVGVNKWLFFDLRVNYNHCMIKPEFLEFNIGGICASAGIRIYLLKLLGKEKKKKVWDVY